MVCQIIETANVIGTTDNEGIAMMSESCFSDNDFGLLLNGLNNNLIEQIRDRIDQHTQSSQKQHPTQDGDLMSNSKSLSVSNDLRQQSDLSLPHHLSMNQSSKAVDPAQLSLDQVQQNTTSMTERKQSKQIKNILHQHSNSKRRESVTKQ